MRVVDSVYQKTEDLQPQILAFAKEYAPKGQYRQAL